MMNGFFRILSFLLITISVSGQSVNILDYGAVSGEDIDNTMAIQNAIDYASKNGTEVYFPQGIFLTGTIQLRSNTTIHLSKNAVWKGIPDVSKYPKQKEKSGQSRAMIYAYEIENIKIYGDGLIYPNGDHPGFQDNIADSYNRPFGLLFIKSKNIRISGITMKNSAYWMQNYLECENIWLSKLKIYNHANLNNDGLDIDGCKNVFVSDLIIDSSDDALCLKSSTDAVTEDIVISNVILSSIASAFKFGTGSKGGFKRITFSNSIIRPSISDISFHQRKSTDGLVGIELLAVDGGFIEDVLINNIAIDSVLTPIHIKLGNRNYRQNKNTDDYIVSHINNINLNNISIKNAGKISSIITGYPGHKIRNISLSNIYLESNGGGDETDNNISVPEASNIYPINFNYSVNFPSYAFYVRHTDGISFSNIKTNLMKDDARSAFFFNDVENITFSDIQAENKSVSQNTFQFDNCNNVNIRNIRSNITESKYFKIVGEGIYYFDRDYSKLKSKISKVKNVTAESVLTSHSFVKLKWQEKENSNGLFKYEIYRDSELVKTTREQYYTDYEADKNKIYNYKIVTVLNDELKSEPYIISVQGKEDNIAPDIIGAKILDSHTIELIFNEPLCENIIEKSNFIIEPYLEIESCTLSKEKNILILKVDEIEIERNYSITIIKVIDLSSNKNLKENLKIEIKDKPIASYWSFDKIQTNQIEDLSGNNNHLNTFNIELVDGIKEQAIKLNGIESYLFAKNSESINFSNNFAVSFWIKLADDSSYKFYRVFSKKQNWNDTTGYEFEYNPKLNKINFCGGSKNENEQGMSNFNLTNDWYHVAASHSCGATSIYINGNLIRKDEYAVKPNVNDYDLFIGTTPAKDLFIPAKIDELFLFNRAVSEKEVKKLFRNIYLK